MNFNNLSNALQPLSLSASSVLKLNENFKISVLNLNVANQTYNVRSAEYFREKSASEDFFQELMKYQYSQETVNFVANVLVLDWELLDNQGEPVPFSTEGMTQLLNDPRFGPSTFTRIVAHSIVASNYETQWENDVTGN